MTTTAPTPPTIRTIEERMHHLQIPFSELTKWAGLHYGMTRRKMLSGRVDAATSERISDALGHFEALMVDHLLANPHLAPEAAAKLRALLEARLADVDAVLAADDALRAASAN
jgi:hypothetical protein